MNAVTILINEVTSVNAVVTTCLSFEEDVLIKSGKYVINAKSLLGVYSLDLSKPIEISIETDNEDHIKQFTEAMKPFVAKC